RHEVDRVGEVLPRAGDSGNLRLAAEFAVGADLAGDSGHLGGETVQLVHHRVQGVFEEQDLAADIDRNLPRQVAAGDGRRHLRAVADLRGQIAGHRVHGIREVLPRAGDPEHVRLTPELALGADLAGDAGDLAGEGVQLIDHRVDGFLQLEDLAAHVDGDL